MTEDLPPTRRAGDHELFFSAARRFAYARRVITRGQTKPIYPELAELAWQGVDAIENGDLEGMFRATVAVMAELERILETGTKAGRGRARRRDYWHQLANELVRDTDRMRMRRLSYEERMQAMGRLFGKSRRQIERDTSKLPDKT